jgi:hypothetical protein
MSYSIFKNTGEKFTVSRKYLWETHLSSGEERMQWDVRDISAPINQQWVASINFGDVVDDTIGLEPGSS